MTLDETQKLITFLAGQGVASFEGFGLKLEFRQDRDVNPFSIPDVEERRKAVMEAFKTQGAADNDDDLYYSVTP